jgi:uncharacterized BrkB/YihY/UPF0761 family membrane protein
MGVLFGALYLYFFILTPSVYRGRIYPKWPGALLVTLWWAVVSLVLLWSLRWLFMYDLTYGSLAGAMIALFFLACRAWTGYRRGIECGSGGDARRTRLVGAGG